MKPFANEKFAVEHVTLERKRYEVQLCVKEKTLLAIERLGHFSLERNPFRNELIYKLHYEVYGKVHSSQHVIRYPANWWEAVKERFAPAWFRDRYPVTFIQITATAEELYPDIPSLPDGSPVIKFAVHRQPDFPIW